MVFIILVLGIWYTWRFSIILLWHLRPQGCYCSYSSLHFHRDRLGAYVHKCTLPKGTVHLTWKGGGLCFFLWTKHFCLWHGQKKHLESTLCLTKTCFCRKQIISWIIFFTHPLIADGWMWHNYAMQNILFEFFKTDASNTCV